ncbi:MAG: Coq4 family protein [Byssovorax sp.]
MLEMFASFAPRRAAVALGKLLQNPDDLPQVFTMVEALSGPTPELLRRRLHATAEGARLLRDRPEIAPLLADRAALASLPEGSLGRAYLAFMESEGISAEGIVAASMQGRATAIEGEGDAERVYFQRRMRDTHDLWHAVTGYRGDILGESALLGFIMAQTGNPGIGLLFAAALVKTRAEPGASRLILEGFRRGHRAAWFVDVAWEELLSRPVHEVRLELGIDALPVYVPLRSAEVPMAAAA